MGSVAASRWASPSAICGDDAKRLAASRGFDARHESDRVEDTNGASFSLLVSDGRVSRKSLADALLRGG